jgi:hypothetical protein
VLNTIDDSITVSVWLKDAYNTDDDDDNWVFHSGAGGEQGPYQVGAVVVTNDISPAGQVYWRAGEDPCDVLMWDLDDRNPQTLKEWHLWCLVKDETVDDIRIYFDGVMVKYRGSTLDTLVEVNDVVFKIGAASFSENYDYMGKMDDFRLYDYALPDKRIEELYRGEDVGFAWAPSPGDYAEGVPRDVNLSWRPGNYVQDTSGHEVFFGTDWDDVNDMTEPCAAQDACEYDPGLLELAQTYYWRVDEVNDNDPCVWKGPVWRFTVADFIILDDFEQYKAGYPKIVDFWYSGAAYEAYTPHRSGSQLDLARRSLKHPVKGGEQAMKYKYTTNHLYAPGSMLDYADACLPLADPVVDGFTDWTSVDVRVLTIFFYGQPDNDTNDTEQMYLGVHDTEGNYAEMRYGEHDGEDMNDLKVKGWQRWDVPLVWYTDSNAAVANDVNFASISSVYLGFGNRRNPVPGGYGAVYFDDLRVSMAICKPEDGPTGDLSGDCFVGVADVGVIGDQWLRSDVNVNPVTEPPTNDPNLVGHWKLDGDANDSSGNPYNGTAKGVYEWTTGKDGNAIDLAGGWVVVDDNGVSSTKSRGWVVVDDNGLTPKLRPKHHVSVMAWINRALATRADIKIVGKGRDNRETYLLEIHDETGALEFLMRDANELEDGGDPKEYDIKGKRELHRREWIHIAGTYDGNTMTLYVNGEVDGTRTPGPYELYSDPNDGLGIGIRWGDQFASFVGKIDDVRVYDRAVTRAEIAYIASGGDGLIPLESEANLLSGEDPEIINFRDFAKLFDYWGDKHLWPPKPLP